MMQAHGTIRVAKAIEYNNTKSDLSLGKWRTSVSNTVLVLVLVHQSQQMCHINARRY